MITKSKSNLFLFCAGILLLLSVFLHLYKLGEIPSGFFCDESSIGYNAWAMALTGADEYGNKYPLFFRCFDNYHEPVMVYSIVPIIKLFGLSEFTVRLPSALFHIIASISFYFLALRYCRNRYIALAGAFVFSVLPWIFPVSRVMMAGYTAMLLGICIGWLFMMRAFGEKSYTWAILSAAGWAFAMYSHNCGRPVTAVILTVFTLCFYRMLLKRWKIYTVFASSFFIFMAPMIIAVMRNPRILGGRFSQIAVWNNSSGIWETLQRIISNYCGYFSSTFLFLSGDGNLRHNSGFGGELYIFLFPLLLAGFVVLYTQLKKNPWYAFILIGIFTYPVAAIFTIDPIHATRSINGAPFWTILCLLGADWLFQSRRILRSILIIISVLAAIEVSFYMTHYFTRYREISENAFSAPFITTLKYAFERMNKDDSIYISPTFFPHAVDRSFKPVWYSHFLFFGRVSPADYQKKGLPLRIVPYGGVVSSPGYLVRSSHVADDYGALYPNFEKVPSGTKCSGRIKYKKNIYYEIYRIGGTE
ncbi:MAG: hypothetical protein A2020_01015 [Lentisphaerae bacterium GWF2_45_14]|nr:MAG: hypothetical protein A2020_01015 [Lentisphaerae bacterium GWF2_45_14]